MSLSTRMIEMTKNVKIVFDPQQPTRRQCAGYYRFASGFRYLDGYRDGRASSMVVKSP